MNNAVFEKFFRDLIFADKLAHGYVFFGSDIRLMENRAIFLANLLEGDKQPLLDALLIGGEQVIGIGQSRTVKEFLWKRPFRSSRRTAIIIAGNGLTTEAQNALLKISEEPPKSSLLIILINSPDLLLPTLNSRFQKIHISENDSSPSAAGGANQKLKKIAGDFLHSGAKTRSVIIKELVEEELSLDFVNFLIEELNRDKIKNWQLIKESLRFRQIAGQFNVNKRLQLEALSSLLD